MNEQSLTDNAGTVLTQITAAIVGNPLIWTPVLFAWAAGFLLTRYLNSKNPTPKANRELRVYGINGSIAFILYLYFNFSQDTVLEQAFLASAVAVLVPAVWFWWQSKK